MSLHLDLHQALMLTGQLHRYLCFAGFIGCCDKILLPLELIDYSAPSNST